jgi:hypothetical protein
MTDLVKSVSIDDLLNKRAAIVERMQQMVKLYQEIDELSAAYFSDNGNGNAEYLMYGYSRHHANRPLFYIHDGKLLGLEQSVQRVDKQGWRYLLVESGMRTFMNAEMRGKWDKLIREDSEKVPELSRGTINATFTQLHNDKQAIFEEGVISVFKNLSWQYKTNLPQKFGKRIILGYVRSYSYSGAGDKLDDLCRVFSILDKQIVKDHRRSDGSELVSMARNKLSGEHEFQYFSARWFKNGNAHITFTRMDLVDQLNRIIAKHFPDALPEPKL